jgi:hypothetical protein
MSGLILADQNCGCIDQTHVPRQLAWRRSDIRESVSHSLATSLEHL